MNQTITRPAPEIRERRDAMLRIRERRVQTVPRAQFEFKARPDGTGGVAYSFNGYAATFESPFEMWDMWGDRYFEILAAGACNRTLANQADVQFLIGHNEASIPLARTKSGTMILSADSVGLEVVVPSLDGRSPIVQSLASAMERGDMDEMSIGFIAVQQQWSPDYEERRITEINLNRGDVSIVCWAANPAANGASMTALPTGSAAAARPAEPSREARADQVAAGTADQASVDAEQANAAEEATQAGQSETEAETAGAAATETTETTDDPSTAEAMERARKRARVLALRR
jgi:HK97 family phage prohead protease